MMEAVVCIGRVGGEQQELHVQFLILTVLHDLQFVNDLNDLGMQ